MSNTNDNGNNSNNNNNDTHKYDDSVNVIPIKNRDQINIFGNIDSILPENKVERPIVPDNVENVRYSGMLPRPLLENIKKVADSKGIAYSKYIRDYLIIPKFKEELEELDKLQQENNNGNPQ